MTNALKAMVEAMAAEIERQSDAEFGRIEGAPCSVIYAPRDGGSFDLEKVARAGLEAINWQPIETAPTEPEDLMVDPDRGPHLDLKVGHHVVRGAYCHGVEYGDIWVPPGWYADGEEVEPTHWRVGLDAILKETP